MSERKKSCRGKGKLKAVQCYAKRTAHSIKRELERFSDYTHKQSGEHKLAYALAVILVAGMLVGFGSVFLANFVVSNPVNFHPSVASCTYTTAWADSANGQNWTTVKSGDSIQGLLRANCTPSYCGTNETVQPLNIGGTKRISGVNFSAPYYIISMTLNIYKGSDTSGQLIEAIPMSVNDSTYSNTMDGWANAYLSQVETNYPTTTNCILASPPNLNVSWVCVTNTQFLANGVYTCQIAVLWAPAPLSQLQASWWGGSPGYWYHLDDKCLIPQPPSLGGYASYGYTLSFFGPGVPVPVIIIVVVIVVAVAIALIRRRT